MSERRNCECLAPIPVTRAVRKGVASKECLRCGLPIAPKLVRPT